MPENKEFNPHANLSGEENLRYRLSLEGRKTSEILRTAANPYAIRWAERVMISSEERKEINRPPDYYTRLSFDSLVTDRLNTLMLETYDSLPAELEIGEVIGKGEEISQEKREKLMETLGEVRGEFWSRWNILEAYRMRQRTSMDLEQVTIGVFTSLEKIYPEASDFGTIGRAKETLPGAERLGKMVDEALRAWCDIGEMPPGEGNIFAENRFKETYQKALDLVTERVLGGNRHIPQEKRAYDPYWQDAQNAARLALEIFRLFDLDVKYDYRENGGGFSDENQERWWQAFLKDPQLLNEISFEGGRNSGDLAKIAHFILRQLSEFAREHPRSIGAPATIGCFPNLTIDFMRMITVKSPIEIKGRKYLSLWKLWREYGVPFGELPWGRKNWEESPRLLENLGVISSEDREKLESRMQAGEKFEGIPEDVYDVPNTLQHFYAVGTVFKALTRKDWDQALDDCRNPNYLQGLNKGFENTFIPMTKGLGIEKKTMAKIVQLVKVNYLIGVLAANLPPGKSINRRKKTDLGVLTGGTMASRQQIKTINLSIGASSTAEGEIIDSVIQAAEESGFLSLTDEKLLKQEKALIKDGVKRARGFLPSETPSLFSSDEIGEIARSGLYSPINLKKKEGVRR